jgi:transposase
VAHDGDVIRIAARTRDAPVACPVCGASTEKVHGYHSRTVTDVPADDEVDTLLQEQGRVRVSEIVEADGPESCAVNAVLASATVRTESAEVSAGVQQPVTPAPHRPRSGGAQPVL